MTMYGIRSNVAWTIRSFIAKCLLSYTSSQKKVDSGDWIHTFLQHMGRQGVNVTTESNAHVSGFCQGKHFTNTFYFIFCFFYLAYQNSEIIWIVIESRSEMRLNKDLIVRLTNKRNLGVKNIFRLVFYMYFVMYTL